MGLTVIMTAVAVCGCGSSDSGNDAKKSDSQTKQQAVKVIDVDLTSEEYAFGVDKNKPELLTQVNDFIKEIKDNGTFDEICNKYFGGGNPTPVKSEKLDTSKDQLLVATNASFEPFEYMKGDSYYGIDMEIAAALAKKLNKELVIQNMEFDSVFIMWSVTIEASMSPITLPSYFRSQAWPVSAHTMMAQGAPKSRVQRARRAMPSSERTTMSR